MEFKDRMIFFKMDAFCSIDYGGGLGNQLFQIFTLLSYCIDNKKVPILHYSETSPSITSRKTYWKDLLREFKVFGKITGEVTVFKELKPFVYQNNMAVQGNVVLIGYYQSYKYFIHNAVSIINLLKINLQIDEVITKFSNSYLKKEEGETLISIHFRLGDYKFLQEKHPILHPSYYHNAISEIRKRETKTLKIIYFCEETDQDAEAISKCYLPLLNVEKIEKVSGTVSDSEQMLLMSCCDWNVIANSTFSWWGAFLNKNKKVIYPNNWFHSETPRDLVLNEWIPVECRASSISLRPVGRFGNHFFRNICFHFISEKYDVKIDYLEKEAFERLGIRFHSASENILISNTPPMIINDENFLKIVSGEERVETNNFVSYGYYQTKEFAILLREYFNRSEVRKSVIESNKHRERYEKNEDCYIHVRLGDVVDLNPGFEYYDLVLSSISFKNGYISSDSLDHTICQRLIKKYNLSVVDGTETDIISFASTCKYLVLSNGTFSWLIGILGFYSSVFYPKITIKWHGDIFVFPDWKCIDFKYKNKTNDVKFSLCIPTMNRYDSFLCRYLPKYIENELIDEIIISDETGEDAEKIRKTFSNPKIKIFTNKVRLGAFLNKIEVVKKASNKWIALIDSDNFADKDYFHTAKKFIKNNDIPENSILSPSWAKPNFDYREFEGKNITKFSQKMCDKLLMLANTGNFILNKSLIYMINFSFETDKIQSSHSCDVIFFVMLLYEQLNLNMFVVPNMYYEHVVHEGSLYLNTCEKYKDFSAYVHKRFSSLFINGMKLSEWQKTIKPISQLLYNCSEFKEMNDGWVDFPIGLGWSIINYSGKLETLQLGPHSQLVLCALTPQTDFRRRGENGRKKILETLEKNGIKNELMESSEYFKNLPFYKFVISPEGNGVDCHRHYEALLAGCIPIVEENSKIREKYGKCPILYTHDYSEISNEYLERKYNEMINEVYDFSKLFMSFYDDKTKKEIVTNGNFWSSRLSGKKWYNL